MAIQTRSLIHVLQGISKDWERDYDDEDILHFHNTQLLSVFGHSNLGFAHIL